MSSIFDSLGIDPGIIIILLLILTIVLAVNVFSSKMRLSRLERKYKMFMKGSDAQSLEKVFVRKFAQIDRLYEAKEDHEHDISFIKHHLESMFSKDNCFLYLKEIVKGESYVMLSQEELEALRKAVNFGLENIEKDE